MKDDQEKLQNQNDSANATTGNSNEGTDVNRQNSVSTPDLSRAQNTTAQDPLEAASNAMTHEPEPEEYDDYKSKSSKRTASYTAPKKIWRVLLIILIVLVVLGGLGGGAYYWFVMRKSNNENKKQTAASQTATQNETEQTVAIETETEHYKSTDFGLEFDYPKDWTVTETEGSGKLTVVSPTVSLGNTKGKVTFRIRNKEQLLPEFDKGNAVAARESEKIAYKQPTGTQRGQTYISFLHYAGSTGASTDFNGVYITGNTGYKAAQAIPKADLTPVSPIIDITFTKTDGTKLSLPSATWDDTNVATPLKNILTSLVIQ